LETVFLLFKVMVGASLLFGCALGLVLLASPTRARKPPPRVVTDFGGDVAGPALHSPGDSYLDHVRALTADHVEWIATQADLSRGPYWRQFGALFRAFEARKAVNRSRVIDDSRAHLAAGVIKQVIGRVDKERTLKVESVLWDGFIAAECMGMLPRACVTALYEPLEVMIPMASLGPRLPGRE
jgi:hypothetical protein